MSAQGAFSSSRCVFLRACVQDCRLLFVRLNEPAVGESPHFDGFLRRRSLTRSHACFMTSRLQTPRSRACRRASPAFAAAAAATENATATRIEPYFFNGRDGGGGSSKRCASARARARALIFGRRLSRLASVKLRNFWRCTNFAPSTTHKDGRSAEFARRVSTSIGWQLATCRRAAFCRRVARDG